MTTQLEAPGLQASWLNGWLAAVGATVLVDDLRLSWTRGPDPIAVFHFDGHDIAGAIADALPTIDDLNNLAIARHRSDAPELPRKASVDAFRARAQLVQSGELSDRDRSLELSMTDLYDLKTPEVPHAPFDPVVPKGLTLHERVVTCRSAVDGGDVLKSAVVETFAGVGKRVQANGLGFDYRRNAAGVYVDSDVYCDPVVELLTFFGLHIFPVRGSGRPAQPPRQRGFTSRQADPNAFMWPCWFEPLDEWAIDALLDRFHSMVAPKSSGFYHRPLQLKLNNISCVYGSIYRRPKGTSDTFRAFTSRRVR